uniref:Uncharacterized protein n=1 Tax=Siphoviridae sp. ct6bU4 TaxID=2825344 RepID=A0A8S5VAI1_9CAUD|nr:MAG TPA: hypothetical protein [Siphoviridae sp. ct6bU4]
MPPPGVSTSLSGTPRSDGRNFTAFHPSRRHAFKKYFSSSASLMPLSVPRTGPSGGSDGFSTPGGHNHPPHSSYPLRTALRPPTISQPGVGHTQSFSRKPLTTP